MAGEEKFHKDLPGYVAERQIDPEHDGEGGQVVLYDGLKADIAGKRDAQGRWVIEHFPSGRMAFFGSKDKGHRALRSLKAGEDDWNLLNPLGSNTLVTEEDEAEPIEAELVDTEQQEGESNFGHLRRMNDNIEEVMDDIASLKEVMERVWMIATKATVPRKVGDEVQDVPDYKTQLAALQLWLERRKGRVPTIQHVTHSRVETYDDIQKRIEDNPDWANAAADIFQELSQITTTETQ